MPIAMRQHPLALTVYKELSAMYLQNKYSQCYYNIIARAQSRSALPDIIKKHHIIPKSLGGSNDTDNLVNLTPKEHFVCHLLLTRMCTGKAKQKMFFGLWAMMNLCNNHQYRKKVKGRIYEQLRSEFVQHLSDATKGKRVGRVSPRKGVTLSQETKDKISMANTGKKTWNKGITHSDKTKAKLSASCKGRVPWNKGIKNFKNLNKP